MMMKTRLLLLVMMLLPLVASADVVEIDGFCYNLISKGNIAEITGSHYSSGDVVIPETVTYNDVEYSVTTIKKNAFANCALNSIEIPSSITKICQEAFSYGSVSSVKISDLAAWCNINFESNFYANPLSKASHLFLNGEEIHDLVIPDGVKTISNYAFYSFSGLTSVKIPSSVTSLGIECFRDCLGIKTVEIGDNTSQEATTILGGRAFYYCENIESIFLGNNIVEIGDDAFNSAKGVRNVVIPNSVTTMDRRAFCGCENLESVQLSENLKRIEWGSFNSCNNLKSIVIPDGVEFLGESAFGYCTSLTEVKLPSNLKKIDWCVFEFCTSLTSIDIPDNTHTIYRLAFIGCTNLKTVTLGKSVKDIYGGAFAQCPVLEEIYCKAKTPPTCYTEYISSYGKGMDVFFDSYKEYITLHVPAKSIEAYKTTEPWSQFKDFVPIIIPEHTLTYFVDGEVYKTYSIEEDEVIIPEPEPVREGFSFSGWSEIPETMPAYDVAVTGTFTELPRCAKPSIMYENGQLSFTCDTEDVEFVTEITDTDVTHHNSATISLTATYIISVYAKAPNHADSDIARATLCWIDATPQKEGITDNVAQIVAHPVLVKTDNGFITVEGIDDRTNVCIYTSDGKQVGSTISQNNRATIATSIQPGSITVVKVGEKSIKVTMK